MNLQYSIAHHWKILVWLPPNNCEKCFLTQFWLARTWPETREESVSRACTLKEKSMSVEHASPEKFSLAKFGYIRLDLQGLIDILTN